MSDFVKIDAVVMAGGNGDAIEPGVAFKGLVEVAGHPMVEHVIDALREANTIDRIIVTIPTDENLGPWAKKADKIVVTDGSFIENALAGAEACLDSEEKKGCSLFACTGDLPAVTPEAIDAYVYDSLATGAAFTYPFIPEDIIMEQAPGSQRTFFKFAEGRFTGGNFMLVSTEHMYAAKEIGQAFFDLRKHPFKIAKFASVSFLAKLATGRITIPEVEKKATKMMGGKTRVVLSKYAVAGADVDKPVDVEIAARAIIEREKALELARKSGLDIEDDGVADI